jgi:hypothetical protein
MNATSLTSRGNDVLDERKRRLRQVTTGQEFGVPRRAAATVASFIGSIGRTLGLVCDGRQRALK